MSAYVFKITTLFKLVLPVLHVLINLKVQCTDFSPTQTGGIINVTGYAATGDKLKEYIIVMSNATWFGALSTCDTIGTFTTSGPNGFPFTYIRNQIFLYFPELIGQPLWTAFHKPNLDGVWYKQKKCNRPLDRKSYKTFANDDPTKRQCLLLNTSSNPDDMDFSWYGASCHDRHSFICSKTFGGGYMMEYIGMARLTEDELASEKTCNATSPEECKKKCNQFGDYHCLYNSSANHADSCVETNRNVKDLPVEFNLTFVGNETISYVKSQINKVVQITIDVPEVDYNDTDLPCYIERVPTTSPLPTTSPATTTVIYDETSTMTVDPDVATFPFINSEQLEQIVDEIKEENTIDIKTLSSYRNKLMCAQDNRPSAKAIGYAGAIFIGLLLGLILLLDVPKIIMDLTSLYRLEMEHCVMDDEEHLLEGSQRRSILHFRRYSF